MENQLQQFNAEMIKGNFITCTKNASITMNGTKIIIHTFQEDNKFDVWIATSSSYNRIANQVDLNSAIEIANNKLTELQISIGRI